MMAIVPSSLIVHHEYDWYHDVGEAVGGKRVVGVGAYVRESGPPAVGVGAVVNA